MPLGAEGLTYAVCAVGAHCIARGVSGGASSWDAPPVRVPVPASSQPSAVWE